MSNQMNFDSDDESMAVPPSPEQGAAAVDGAEGGAPESPTMNMSMPSTPVRARVRGINSDSDDSDDDDDDEDDEDAPQQQDGNEFQCSLADYQKHSSPCYGNRNPQRLDNPFWQDMIKLGCNAYGARRRFDGIPTEFFRDGVVWCYQRMGASVTELQDGRFVHIGGEHEDYYDPDFYIYNDVVIHDGKGKFEIYGYPKEAFPPTDFHSATLVGEWIYIIGCIGYPEQRQEGRTPVYRLKVPSWEIEEVETSGEIPSWLHNHRSNYEVERHVIRIDGGDQFAAGEDDRLQIIPNTESFELDLSSFRWRKLK